jgi:riboflavin synthase
VAWLREGECLFSGIIENTGSVSAIRAPVDGADGGVVRLDIDLAALAEGVRFGESVAINGVCLTVTQLKGSVASFDVIPETLRRTTLGLLRAGQRVNVERALRVGDRIDGHFVQGHIDGIGRVERVERSGEYKLWVAPERGLLDYIIRKGSVALDGVSLTIADVGHAIFSVALIPVTLQRTVLGERAAGETLNIETDVLARAVVQQLKRMSAAGRELAIANSADGDPEGGGA